MESLAPPAKGGCYPGEAPPLEPRCRAPLTSSYFRGMCEAPQDILSNTERSRKREEVIFGLSWFMIHIASSQSVLVPVAVYFLNSGLKQLISIFRGSVEWALLSGSCLGVSWGCCQMGVQTGGITGLTRMGVRRPAGRGLLLGAQRHCDPGAPSCPRQVGGLLPDGHSFQE